MERKMICNSDSIQSKQKLIRILRGIPSKATEPFVNIITKCLTNISSMATNTLFTTASIETTGQSSDASVCALHVIPNELIVRIVERLSFEDISQLSITNKWFRDFIIQYFFKSNTGFQSLFRSCSAADSTIADKQTERLLLFKQLGLLLKRITCLLPTTVRIDFMVDVFRRLDGIPTPSLSPQENHSMRFVFQCYGQLIHRLTAGWDECELKYVFKVLETNTQMEKHITTVLSNALGARTPLEYYIRSFYRLVCLDPTQSDDKCQSISETLFWLNRILKRHSVPNRAKLLLIIYGPIVSISPAPTTIPYIGWWDLTDTFFIQTGLEDLGFAFFMLYGKANTNEEKRYVISLLENVIKLPQNWLFENTATLLFFAGDDITYQYLLSKLSIENYAEVAQRLVYMTLVTYKLTKDTKPVFHIIERLISNENKSYICSELPIAFCEAFTDIDSALEMEDEREVTELQDLIAAKSDLLKCFMSSLFGISSSSDESSQESRGSQNRNAVKTERLEE